MSITIDPRLHQVCEALDAAIFTGDECTTPDDFIVLEWYMDRWSKAILKQKQQLVEEAMS